MCRHSNSVAGLRFEPRCCNTRELNDESAWKGPIRSTNSVSAIAGTLTVQSMIRILTHTTTRVWGIAVLKQQ